MLLLKIPMGLDIFLKRDDVYRLIKNKKVILEHIAETKIFDKFIHVDYVLYESVKCKMGCYKMISLQAV